MGFWKDLLGPPQPCDLCQLGAAEWSQDHSASREWKVWGHGLRVELLLCKRCHSFVRQRGLMNKTPMASLAAMHAEGLVPRPPVHAYLQHPQWKKLWMHMLETGGVEVSDEFEALAAIRKVEPGFFKSADPTHRRA